MSLSERLILSLFPHCKTLKQLQQLQGYIHKTNLSTNPLITGKLLYYLTLITDDVAYISRYFNSITNPDTFMHNTLIRALPPQNSVTHFVRMLKVCESRRLDSFTFVFVLKSVGGLGCLEVGKQVHCQVLVNGFDGHLFVGTSLVSMYGECGCAEYARKVFDEMLEPNVVAWNAVLTACFRGGDLKGGEEVFRGMPLRNLTSWNVVLNGYVKAGEVEVAKEVFGEMVDKDDVSWSTMIVGFGRIGRFEDAFGFFRGLREAGGRVNEVSLTGVLSACAEAGPYDFGMILHGFVERAGFRYVVSVNNALLDTYAKCGNLEMARLVFERMQKRSVITWSAMIAGLAMHGYGEEAIRLFHLMEESGIRPDGVTFISLLYACSHAGLVEQGCMYFSMMKDAYGLEPVVEHYGCMVDLYGRAGRLEKAYEIICEMPVPLNDVIWRTLLGACSFHGNVELAKQVKKKLLEFDPNNSGDRVLLSNIYAVSGMWKDVVTVRRSMAEQSIKKLPGWSSIEVNKVIYNFVAGEKESVIAEEANEKLREVMLKLRIEEGYTPVIGTVLHDIEEEDKEDSVTRHSEKLAVAFGLARLGGRKTLRVVKNLRICKDCHIVMKLISKVYGVEIVVRDRSRFHSFKYGSCSCKDYW